MRALGLQALDHVLFVNDFMAHIDRRPVFLQGALDDLDGAYDPRAKTAGLSQYHFHPLPPGRAPDGALRRKGTAGQDPSNALAVRNNWPHDRDNQARFTRPDGPVEACATTYEAQTPPLSSVRRFQIVAVNNGLAAPEVSALGIYPPFPFCRGFGH
jgi:hypothetical protein